jgi:hypothetical protein
MEIPPDRTGEPQLAPEQEESPIAEVSTRRIEILNLCILAVACLGSLWVSGAFALGVLAGGVLMAANFRVIVGVIRSVFLKGSTRISNVALYWLKFAGIMLSVGVLIVSFRVDAIGFLIGLSTILIAITAEAVLRLLRR